MPLRTQESKACQGSLLGSGTGFSYSGNVSVPSYRSSLDDCAQQQAFALEAAKENAPKYLGAFDRRGTYYLTIMILW